MTLTKELGESFQRRFGHAAEHFSSHQDVLI